MYVLGSWLFPCATQFAQRRCHFLHCSPGLLLPPGAGFSGASAGGPLPVMGLEREGKGACEGLMHAVSRTVGE